jgi:hypothetical protein
MIRKSKTLLCIYVISCLGYCRLVYCGGENCSGLIFEANLQLRKFLQPRLVAYHVTEHISTTAVLCKLEKKARTQFLVAEWHFHIEWNTSYVISSTVI